MTHRDAGVFQVLTLAGDTQIKQKQGYRLTRPSSQSGCNAHSCSLRRQGSGSSIVQCILYHCKELLSTLNRSKPGTELLTPGQRATESLNNATGQSLRPVLPCGR